MNSSFVPCTHPAAGLYLKHFWQTEGTPHYREEHILPKGDIELIFSFGDALNFQRQGIGEGRTPRCFVNGISNVTVRLMVPRHQSFFGVVLQPAAVKKLLSVPSGAFLNAITDLEAIDKNFGSLWHQLADCTNFEERVGLIQAWVLQKLSTIYQQEAALSGFLNNSDEIHTVAQMAGYFCYSTRQLHRKVQELFGMSSEVLLRYKRYQQALNQMHYSKETLTRIAYHCGYYDQAHFSREFKEYTGLSPQAYRQQQSHLPGHLYQ
jgi:AraC-like DNA-binding protein